MSPFAQPAERAPLHSAPAIILFFLGFALCSLPSGAQSSSDSAACKPIRFPIFDGSKWGYIDTTGTVVITPQFVAADEFQNGERFARVRVGPSLKSARWAFLDATGRILQGRLFDDATIFWQGYAYVLVGREWGVIDTAGTVVAQPRYDFSAPFFRERRRSVKVGEKWGFIDPKGVMVIPPRYPSYPGDFAEGLAAVQVGEKWGFVDTTGRVVIEPQFDEVYGVPGGVDYQLRGFSEGRHPVAIGHPPSQKWGYVDRTGRLVVPPQFERAAAFSEGLAPVKQGGKWGYIDTTGVVVISAEFDGVGRFSDGRATVTKWSPESARVLWGYIDRRGKVVVWLPKADRTEWFSEGLAAVSIDGKNGYVDTTGTVVIAPQFETAEAFAGGVARVKFDDGAWGYLNRSGRVIWKSSSPQAAALTSQPMTGAAGPPDTSGLAGSGPLVERVARFVERLENAETRGGLGVVAFGPTPLLPQLVGADRRVRAYADTHPDDARLLILAARLGRLRWVAEPIVFSKEHQPSLDTLVAEHAPLHAHLDRARALEPNNAEAHYWKGRLYGLTFSWRKMLYGFNDPPDSVARRFSAYADSALLFGRRAVELVPQQVSYREALALYFVFAERPDEAAVVVRDVAGGRHPIYLLLSDWQMLPLPPGATPWPSQTRLYAGMKKEEGWSYAELRVRWYVLATSAAQVEAFYKTRWPSLRFFETQGGEEALPGARALTQFFRMKGAALEPSERKKDVEQSPDKLPDGFMVGLVEMTNAPEEVRSKLPVTVGGTFSILSVMNVRRVR